MIASVDKAWTEDWLRRTPLGRMGTTEEVGKAVVALASDQFGFMTGSDVVMDGGEYRTLLLSRYDMEKGLADVRLSSVLPFPPGYTLL